MLSTVLLAALGAGASLVAAQQSAQNTANETAIALIEAQWINAGLDTPIQSGLALGQPLQAQGLLEVMYGNTEIQTGEPYPADAVANRPTLAIVPGPNSNFSADNSYTLALVDFSAIAQPDPELMYRHALANDVKITTNEDGTLGLTNGTQITYYAGPGPIAGTGAHRYSWLLFQQPENFTAPANLSTSGVAPSHWDFPAYVAETGLGAPVAAQFFTVENGAPSVPAVSTSAVNTATLSIESSNTAASSGAAAGETSTRGTGSQAAASGTPEKTGAAAANAVISPVAAAALAVIVAMAAVLA